MGKWGRRPLSCVSWTCVFRAGGEEEEGQLAAAGPARRWHPCSGP